MKFVKLSHCLYYCDYHMAITTKYRHQWLNEGIFAYLQVKLTEIRKHYPLINFKTINYDPKQPDHIHLLISIPPTMSVGSVVRVVKSNTSRELKQKFPFLKKLYWGTDGIWSDGYFVSTVGVNEQTIKNYIENQGKEDSGQALLDL
ncbi:TPA: IS200/IS605 family transposase [Patescibacteria group bacterium]|nr:IS200/IS605 family transposase [Patescibacteria group bacterium]